MAYEHSAANRIHNAETDSPRARASTVQATAPTTDTAPQISTLRADGRRRAPSPGGCPPLASVLTVVDMRPPCRSGQRPDDAARVRVEHARTAPGTPPERDPLVTRPVTRSPRPPGRSPPPVAAWRSGPPGSARCPPPSRKTRTAGRGTA